jgi:DNA (cytosine-5)-methyltransferase 1
VKLLDLFSGIGAFSLAASWYGIETTQFVEIDPYCQKVLSKNFPNIPIHDDITTFTSSPGQFDIITAGFPCQDISEANPNGRGLEGERSGLVFNVFRLLRTIQPQFVIFENVPALINGGLEQILWELNESGFDAEWQIISSASMGSPHLRERLFIIAYPKGQRSGGNSALQGRANPTPIGDDSFWRQNPHPEPSISVMDVGISRELVRHQLKAIGNSINPYCAAIAFERIMEINKMMTLEAPPKKTTTTFLNLSELRLEGATQQRARMNFSHIQTLEDALLEASELEPIQVISDGENYWVVDGFHRAYAYRNLDRPLIPAIVTQGNQRDAILASVSANAENLALPRNRADKHKAVKTLLTDSEWGQWSDREIAKIAKVHHATVAAVRKISVDNYPPTNERKFNSKHGTVGTIKVRTQSQKDKAVISTEKANIEDFTARDGHLIPKSALDLEETETPSRQSAFVPEPKPEAPKVIEIDLKERLIGFVSNLDLFSEEQQVFALKRVFFQLLTKGCPPESHGTISMLLEDLNASDFRLMFDAAPRRYMSKSA